MLRKKILFIESGLYEGGSFVSLHKHIKALNQTSITPVIVFLNPNKWIDILREKGYIVYLVRDKVFSEHTPIIHRFVNALFMKGYIRYLNLQYLTLLHRKSIRLIEEIIKRESIDIVHLNTEIFRDRIGLIAGIRQKKKIVAHLRSKYENGRIHYSKDYLSLVNEHVKYFVAVSKDTARFWSNDVGIEESKIRVIYDYFEKNNQSQKHTTLTKKRDLELLCVANLVPVKGHEFLFKVFGRFRKEVKSSLHLLGKGEKVYKRYLTEVAKNLGICDDLIFHGYSDMVPDFIRNADIVLLFSKREGLPNILLEALGNGSIVVATNVGGISEIIEDGDNGFLVEYGDILGSTEKLKEITKMELGSISERAIATIHGKESRFVIEFYRSEMLSLYSDFYP